MNIEPQSMDLEPPRDPKESGKDYWPTVYESPQVGPLYVPFGKYMTVVYIMFAVCLLLQGLGVFLKPPTDANYIIGNFDYDKFPKGIDGKGKPTVKGLPPFMNTYNPKNDPNADKEEKDGPKNLRI
jgi:hypothetical protein